MLGIDPEIGSSALRLWIAAGAAAVLVVICALAIAWQRLRWRGSMLAALVLVGAISGAMFEWAWLDQPMRDQSVERRALETRAEQLSAQALTPGSALACLDGLAGDGIESACEKALFATPATAASATSYAAARLALLSDMVAYAKRGGDGIEPILSSLRRSLETDRFGFVAQALAAGDGCTSENCATLALLRDSSRVRANLKGATLAHYLEHYLPIWAQAPDPTVTDATGGEASAADRSPHKIADIDFPSAASIPPVSIMNPEPKGPPAAESNTRTESARRPHRQAASPPAQGQASATVDPVWMPGASGVAPATAAAAPANGPVQLNPFPPAQGNAAHTQ